MLVLEGVSEQSVCQKDACELYWESLLESVVYFRKIHLQALKNNLPFKVKDLVILNENKKSSLMQNA